jgi:hypothetical protein
MGETLLTLRTRDKACIWCGLQADTYSDWSLEHILPTSRGGTSSQVNLALACLSCNTRRKSRPVADYAIRIARRKGVPHFSTLLIVLKRLSEAGTPKERTYASKQLHRLEDWLEQFQRWGMI